MVRFGPAGFQQQALSVAVTGGGYVLVSRRQGWHTLSVWDWLKSCWDQNIHRLQISILSPRQPCPLWGSESPGNCCSSLKLGVDMELHWAQKAGPLFYDSLTFMLVWTLRKQLFVLEWSCGFCKIYPITRGTKGKELREVVKSWWLNKLLGSRLAFLSSSGYYKVNLNGKVST